MQTMQPNHKRISDTKISSVGSKVVAFLPVSTGLNFVSDKRHQYYLKNRKIIIEKSKKYRDSHKDSIKKYKREDYLKNKVERIQYQYKDNGLFKTWNCLKTRCNNKKHPKYKYYGGKGIKIKWKNYQDFKKDMYKSYLIHLKRYGRKNTTLDKLDNSKDYSKKNCRWATMKEQNDNRGNSANRIVLGA